MENQKGFDQFQEEVENIRQTQLNTRMKADKDDIFITQLDTETAELNEVES